MKALAVLCLVMAFTVGTAVANDSKSKTKEAAKANASEQTKSGDAKELSGISIVGNDDAPKSLYIVPWKSSEIGVETSMGMMLNEAASPVDRDVFKRQLDFYEVSNKR